MKALTLVAIFLFVAAASAQTPSATPCLTTEDAKQVRQLIADNVFLKQRAEAAEAQRDAAIQSREQWKSLFESEKDRADRIQGQRIAIFEQQAVADAKEIGRLNAEIIRVKAGRKWWAILGGLGGVGAGYFIGKNIDKATTILLPTQNRPAFRF